MPDQQPPVIEPVEITSKHRVIEPVESVVSTSSTNERV